MRTEHLPGPPVIALCEQMQIELAQQQGELCLANDPPAEMRGLVEQFLTGLGVSDATTTVAPTTGTP